MCVDTSDDNWLCSCLAKVCCGILCICCAKSCMDSCNEKEPPPQQMHPGPYYGGGNQPMVHYPNCIGQLCLSFLCACCVQACCEGCCKDNDPPHQPSSQHHPVHVVHVYQEGSQQPMMHPPNNGPYGPPNSGPYGPPNSGPYGPPNSGPYGPPNPGPYGPVMTTQPTGNYPPPQPNYPMPHAYGAPTAPGSYPPTYTEAVKH